MSPIIYHEGEENYRRIDSTSYSIVDSILSVIGAHPELMFVVCSVLVAVGLEAYQREHLQAEILSSSTLSEELKAELPDTFNQFVFGNGALILDTQVYNRLVNNLQTLDKGTFDHQVVKDSTSDLLYVNQLLSTFDNELTTTIRRLELLQASGDFLGAFTTEADTAGLQLLTTALETAKTNNQLQMRTVDAAIEHLATHGGYLDAEVVTALTGIVDNVNNLQDLNDVVIAKLLLKHTQLLQKQYSVLVKEFESQRDIPAAIAVLAFLAALAVGTIEVWRGAHSKKSSVVSLVSGGLARKEATHMYTEEEIAAMRKRLEDLDTPADVKESLLTLLSIQETGGQESKKQ